MAYLHCHSCCWSQDDFWSKRYNPLTKLCSKIKWLGIPRLIEFDKWVLHELCEYTNIPVLRFKTHTQDIYVKNHRNIPSTSTVKIFSWNMLVLEFVKELKIFKRQKWWTYKAWKKDKDSATCPHCGKHNFDID